MEPSQASYYRAILFADGTDQRSLPPGLVKMHTWAVRRNHALGLGGAFSKQMAFATAMTWLSGTAEGREFAKEFTGLGDIFTEAGEEEPVSAVDWSKVAANAKVTVPHGKSTRPGEFVALRGQWVDVRVDGDVRHYKARQVQLAGA